ncbi:type IV secretory system conjugative DNA transfer family protein [Streptococcus iniae]|uniref:VirD4-like conjugal transfer protein, CD1115 family n=1 Tax=Streptococcus iniae TaxID=1346 RepID=UPI000EF6C72B|nr:type IV secretory system conjugative DNA transfer family protein [Streptococcus iniae]RLV28405.1 type IV secretory system conjugative DNA transfer family protein [Streptococcus iniae]
MMRELHSNNTIKLIIKLLKKVVSLLFLIISNIVIRLIHLLPFVSKGRVRFEKEAKPVFYFKTYKSFTVMGILFSLIAFTLTNYLITILRAAINYVYLTLTSKILISFPFDSLLLKNLLNYHVFMISPIFAWPLFCLGLFIAWRSAWVNFEQYRNYNFNEEGDDRFATVKEIHQQYKKIANKHKTFPGDGGIPVLHETKSNLVGFTLETQILWQNRKYSQFVTNAQKVLGMQSTPSGYYYIEDAATNTLGIGMTRSGKGEGFITGTIDINSRAENQPSMIIGDPKGEHYQSSYKTMRKRGFGVEVLSFQNMDWSMSYDPLALATDSAKRGYYEKTQTRINAVSEAIYRKTKAGQGNGTAIYFENSSISLFNAIAMALVDRANEAFQNGEEDAWDTVTVRNIAKFLTDLGSEEVFVDELGEVVEAPERDDRVKVKSKLTVYFDNLRKINQEQFSKFREMADINFRASDFASEETKGNVYSSMMTGINLFLQDNIAKLTSKNSIDLESVGFPRRLSIKFRSSSHLQLQNDYAHKTAKISIFSKRKWGKTFKNVTHVNEATALIDAEGYLTYVIEPKLPNEFTIVIDFDHPNNEDFALRGGKYTLQAKKVYQKSNGTVILDKYTNKAILDSIAIQIVDKPQISLLQESDIELIYSDSPKIIYLVTPPNRTEYNALISLFLDQLFNANYELALSNGRKCVNRILHVLDEFTNIPEVPHMDTKISIGLGQNILYCLWIQNLEQLTEKYGKNTSATIKDNCSLKVYIKSTSPETNKSISGDLGTRTITKRRKSGNILDEANPNVSFEGKRQELLTPTQLGKLQEGEAVILRGVKGRDLSGHKITTDPIFLHEKTSLPYRYMFLQEEFDHSMTLADIPVDSPHRSLNLQDVAVEAKSTFNNIIDWRRRMTSKLATSSGRPKLAVRHKPAQAKSASSFDSPVEVIKATVDATLNNYDSSIDYDEELFVDDVI